MKILGAIFIVLILAIQYPLWLGKGGWLHVADVDRKLRTQRQTNERLQQRNQVLHAEVADLKRGYDAIEERARCELGLLKNDEVFFQFVDAPRGAATSPTSPASPPASRP